MGLNLNQFLGHSATSGGRSKYLTKWKKNRPPQVDTWLHTASLIESLWRHGMPRLFEKTDKTTDEKSVEVWSGNWTCWEEDELLSQQYLRDRDTGERVYPPTICPMCRLIEYIRDSVDEGILDWTAPLFKWVGSDPSKAITIHAGGMYNAYGRDDLSDEEKQQLKDARIYRNDAWKQNMMAKLSYVFSVVDNNRPADGVQIAIETSLLGDKVKEVINAAMMEAEEEGNPLENPYVIRWIYRPDEKQFNKKYNAVKMGKFPCTPEIERLIRETDPPDLARVVAKKDPKVLLTQLQDVYIGEFDIPWDDIFGDAIKAWPDIKAEQEGKDKSTDFDTEKMDKEKPTATRVAGNRRGKGKTSKPTTTKATKAKAKPSQRALCYECGEFITEGEKCGNCGYNPTPPQTADTDDDLPY